MAPTALVPVELGERGLSKRDGIEAKEAVVAQLAAALEVIGRYSPGRILTLGGECSVSVAPFSWLAGRYGDELAVLRLLPATLAPGRVALVGLHAWTEDDFPNIARWGIKSFLPDELHRSSQPLLDWLKASGCSRVAIHFDVDVVDSNEIAFGLGEEISLVLECLL